MNLLQDQLRGEIHHHDCNYVHPGTLLPEPSIYAILSTAPCYHGSSDYITDLIKAATHFGALAPTLLSYSPKIQFGYPFDSR